MLADKIAYMAQLVEHILGKDEVPGSNPGISLKRRHLEIGAIFIFSELRDGCASHAKFAFGELNSPAVS